MKTSKKSRKSWGSGYENLEKIPGFFFSIGIFISGIGDFYPKYPGFLPSGSGFFVRWDIPKKANSSLIQDLVLLIE